MSVLVKVIGVILLSVFLVSVTLVVRFFIGKNSIAEHNQEITQHKVDLKPVDSLTVLPVVDLLGKDESFKTEPGTAVLIKTDNESLLFDVGYNVKQEEISPLLHNLSNLDINLEDVGPLAISHNHADHVGGFCFRENWIELTKGDVDLGGRPVYTPVPLTCETAAAQTVDRPALITKEIASTGPLAQQMFIPGKLYEQSLLVNLKGKGLVLISGCGHPGILNMVDAAQKITGIPVYAVVGGLHLYYTRPEAGIWGNIFGSSKLFCRTPGKEEVTATIDGLKELGVKKAYISPHDADRPTLDIFAEKFGPDFQVLKAGQQVVF